MKHTHIRILSLLLTLVMLLAALPAAGMAEAEESFAQKLEARYVDPDRYYQSDVRWWLGDAALTDEALLYEIQALYDHGFHGVELCMQDDANAPDEIYAYGSDVWSHKWKLMMNKLLDLGMEVSLTSGTNWATSNVPGLDPDSQAASQVVAVGKGVVQAGETITALPKPETMRESNKGAFLGAYAYRIDSQSEEVRWSSVPWFKDQEYTSYHLDHASMVDLSTLTDFTEGETIYDQAMEWTVPEDGDYLVVGLWTHGNYKTSSPGAETCYATNYFDIRGVEALRAFWEEHYLDDPALNEKIMNGDVQLFMDSVELDVSGGATWWSEDIREEFIARKGYDPLPYVILFEGLPMTYAKFNAYMAPAEGFNVFADDADFGERAVNDWADVLTQLYVENMLIPLKEWLNSVGIETRAQISYGVPFEISEPSLYVDYPEAESLQMYDNVDILRLFTGGAKLQNKVLSTETGGEAQSPTDALTPQMHLNGIYAQYAAGFQRVVWHIWSSVYGYGEEMTWPGWGTSFDRWGMRQVNARDFDEFNAHIGRIQQLMQTGVSRTDVGFIHNNWNQGVKTRGGIADDITGMNWQLAHMGVYYRSTELQDNGYTYDYLSPELLKAEGVYFDTETRTIEPAGYKALVIYQNWLDADGAQLILDWAEQGLPVFIMEGAAVRTPFNDGRDAELAETMAALKALSNVREVEIYSEAEDFDYFDPVADGYSDGLYAAMQEMGVRPYSEYVEPNHQLLTQMREDEDGNRYLYAYNYCTNDYHSFSYIEEVRSKDHGTSIQTEIEVEGMYVPYQIDAWTGKVTELANYRYEDGRTVFALDLNYGDIALYALEAVEAERPHITDTNAEFAYVSGDGLVIRATRSGEYYAVKNDGDTVNVELTVPEARDITGWDVTVESWTAGTEMIYSEETIGDVHTVNTRAATNKEKIDVELDTLTTWDNIPEVGIEVSGLGHYEATFPWDASAADGAYIDFGEEFVSTMKIWINGQKVGGGLSSDPSKEPRSVIEGVEGLSEYTGGLNWVTPIVDVSEYLVDGENTIVIEYSSTTTNAQLASGAIEPNPHIGNWWYLDCDYRAYGPAQAVLVPFVEAAIG